jgi:hypothetical protein
LDQPADDDFVCLVGAESGVELRCLKEWGEIAFVEKKHKFFGGLRSTVIVLGKANFRSPVSLGTAAKIW